MKTSLISLCMVISSSLYSMDAEQPASSERTQHITITNKSEQAVRVFSEVMFRQAEIVPQQKPHNSENYITRAITYLSSQLFSVKTNCSIDGDIEEPKCILMPHETNSFTVLIHDIPIKNILRYRVKAWINIYRPEDKSICKETQLASYLLDKTNEIEAYVITENADNELTISRHE